VGALEFEHVDLLEMANGRADHRDAGAVRCLRIAVLFGADLANESEHRTAIRKRVDNVGAPFDGQVDLSERVCRRIIRPWEIAGGVG